MDVNVLLCHTDLFCLQGKTSPLVVSTIAGIEQRADRWCSDQKKPTPNCPCLRISHISPRTVSQRARLRSSWLLGNEANLTVLSSGSSL